jgi:hypothetical protein
MFVYFILILQIIFIFTLVGSLWFLNSKYEDRFINLKAVIRGYITIILFLVPLAFLEAIFFGPTSFDLDSPINYIVNIITHGIGIYFYVMMFVIPAFTLFWLPFILIAKKLKKINELNYLIISFLIILALGLYKYSDYSNIWCSTNPFECLIKNLFDVFRISLFTTLGFYVGAKKLFKND